jgi:hypothetical protein
VRKYPGSYIVVVDGKVLSAGRSMLSAYKKVSKTIPTKKEVGLFYIPAKGQYPMLLNALSLPRD